MTDWAPRLRGGRVQGKHQFSRFLVDLDRLNFDAARIGKQNRGDITPTLSQMTGMIRVRLIHQKCDRALISPLLTSLSAAQVNALKRQPDTAQGRRDALLLCLLLDHGLRVGEVAALEVTAVNLTEGTLTFYRPKVGKTQTHQLSRDALKAAQAWFTSGDAPAVGPLLRASTRGGALGPACPNER